MESLEVRLRIAHELKNSVLWHQGFWVAKDQGTCIDLILYSFPNSLLACSVGEITICNQSIVVNLVTYIVYILSIVILFYLGFVLSSSIVPRFSLRLIEVFTFRKGEGRAWEQG